MSWPLSAFTHINMNINVFETGSVDHVMTSDDKNDDGYLSYAEYANSRKMSKKFLQRMSPVNETVV